MSIKATVLVPTSIDRGPLLPYSLGSIQRQTVQDIEIFIIGDGVEEITRRHVHELMERDPRIRFFDHPKHSRRGEPYRHAALQEARGEIVCYMCDRDLMLPDHVETLLRLLQDADFATTLLYDTHPDALRISGCRDAADPDDRARLAKGGGYSLSAFGHTLKYYRVLPHGWRETPRDRNTDNYMCQQFLSEPTCRAVSGDQITMLYFNRGRHPGWPVAQRLPELRAWSALMQDPEWIKALRHNAFWDPIRQQHVRSLHVEPLLSLRIRGQPPGEYLRRKLRQVKAKSTR